MQNLPSWMGKKQNSNLISNSSRMQLTNEEIHITVINCAASLTFQIVLAMTDGNHKIPVSSLIFCAQMTFTLLHLNYCPRRHAI